ncbi:MAG: nuclear transport factor 2 family protein [Nocardioidaceae bacterium]|nr:nuclear transport factor 2 family protein [Nocardioidaceae bacterium]
MSTLEERLARMEAIEEIKALKHRYLRACDAKRPEEFRDCFIADGAVVDYGPRVGRFEDADGIAAVFSHVALKRVNERVVVLDMHHAMHADIQIVAAGEATGQWTLRFRQVDLEAAEERLSAIEYADRYVIEDDQWRIARCEVSVLWTLVKPLPEGFKVTEAFS